MPSQDQETEKVWVAYIGENVVEEWSVTFPKQRLDSKETKHRMERESCVFFIDGDVSRAFIPGLAINKNFWEFRFVFLSPILLPQVLRTCRDICRDTRQIVRGACQ